MGKVQTKRPVKPPAFLQALIQSVSNAADDKQLQSVLRSFEAPYHFERAEERSLYNWIDVLNRIDEALERAVRNEPIVLLVASPVIVEDDKIEEVNISKENRELIVDCLKVTLKLVINSSDDTKNVYNSVEHLTSLLAMDDENILLLTLEIIRALLHRNARLRPTRAHGSPILGNRLLSLSRGWGGREGGLGLVDCCSSTSTSLPREGASVRLDFMKEESLDEGDASEERITAEAGKKGAINIEDVGAFEGNEWSLLNGFAKNAGLPRRLRFTLSARYRRAVAFVEGLESRQRNANIRLLSLTALAQMQLSPEPLPIVFHSEPELVSELVALACADPSEGLGSLPFSLRISALKCLTAISTHGQRLKQILLAAGVSSHHGILPSMLRSEIATLTAEGPKDGSSSTSPNQVDSMASLGVEGEFSQPKFVEALLGLVFALATAFPMSQGPSFLVMSGALGTIIPLLSDKKPEHARVVGQAIWALKCIIENTQTSIGAAAFRDHSGLGLVARRIVDEVCEMNDKDLESADKEVEGNALTLRGESRALYEQLSQVSQHSNEISLQTTAPSSSAASRGVLPHSKWALLRALLRLLALAHRHSGGHLRELTEGNLFKALRIILARPFFYGGSLFAAAATGAADIAHAEPTAASTIAASGIPTAILKSIQLGLPPSGEAIRCIPGVLAAICLSAAGLEEVERSKALKPYLLRLATPFYGRAMHGETPVGIGTALEELKRHVPSLKDEITGAFLAYLRAAAGFMRTETDPQRMEWIGPDGKKKTQAELSSILDKTRLTIAHNAARLGGLAVDISDGDVSVKQEALECLLDLCYAPAFAGIDSGVMPSMSSSPSAATASNTLNSIINAIRNFVSQTSRQNYGNIFRVLFDHFIRDAAALLQVGVKLGDNWLGEEKNDPKEEPKDTKDNGSLEKSLKDAMDVLKQSSSGKIGEGSGDGSSKFAAEQPLEGDAAVKERAALQRRMDELGRMLRVDIIILSGLSRMPNFPVLSWLTRVGGSQLGSIIATVERSARWHLARTYTGVTVEITKDADLFCTAKVTSVKLETDRAPAAPKAPEEGGSTQVDETTNTEGDAAQGAASESKSQMPKGRQELKGLAYSLATLIASIERMYGSLSRGLTAQAKKNLTRDALKHTHHLATMLGRIMTMHLICAKALWEKDLSSPGIKSRVPPSWDYLRGILREIRSVLYSNPWGIAPSPTQPLVLEAFIYWGGASLLKDILHPEILFRDVSVAEEEKMEFAQDAGFLSKFSAESKVPAEKETSEMVPADQNFVEKFEGEARDDIEAPENVILSSAMGLLDSYCQLVQCMCQCPGLSSSAPSLAKYSRWRAPDLHRTSQVLAINAIENVVSDHDRIFKSNTLSDQLISSLINLVHTNSSSRDDLLKNEEELDAGSLRERDDGRAVESGMSSALPDNSVLSELLRMGFPRERATAAVQIQGHNGIPGCTDWLLRSSNTVENAQNERGETTAEGMEAKEKDGKDKEMEINEQASPLDTKEALRACCHTEIEQLRKALEGKFSRGNSATVPDSTAIVNMARSVLFQEYLENGSVANVELQSSPVSRPLYEETTSSFFSSLRHLAIAALKHSATPNASKECMFLAVELSNALERGSELPHEYRSLLADSIAEGFFALIDTPESLSMRSSVAREEAVRMVNSAQLAAVWTHFGGAGARTYLRKKQLLERTFEFLVASFSSFWEKNLDEASPSPTDDEAAKPIEGLSLEDGKTSTSVVGASSTTIPSKELNAQLATVALLILDGFIRYSRSDKFAEYARNSAPRGEETQFGELNFQALRPERDEAMTDELVDTREVEKRVEKAEEEAAKTIKEGIATALKNLSPLIASDVRDGRLYDSLDLSQTMELVLRMIDSKIVENSDALLALVQLACSLTEDPGLATTFRVRGGLKSILSIPSVKKLHWKPVHGLLRTLIRHLVEDKETLREAMEQEMSTLLNANLPPHRRVVGLHFSSLIKSAVPLFRRDPELFVEVIANAYRLRPNLEVVSSKKERPVEFPRRENVTEVMTLLVEMLVLDKAVPEEGSISTNLKPFLALLRITELVEMSDICAQTFLSSTIPNDENQKAIDYVLRNLMTAPLHVSSSRKGAQVTAKVDISDAARALFTALCEGSNVVQTGTVEALAAACTAESQLDSPRPGMLKSIAMCFTSSLKEPVVALLFNSGIAMSMAKCLSKIDMSQPGASDTANLVLKAFVALGQISTSSYVAANVHEDEEDDEIHIIPYTGRGTSTNT